VHDAESPEAVRGRGQHERIETLALLGFVLSGEPVERLRDAQGDNLILDPRWDLEASGEARKSYIEGELRTLSGLERAVCLKLAREPLVGAWCAGWFSVSAFVAPVR
jgi:hypothetical protein